MNKKAIGVIIVCLLSSVFLRNGQVIKSKDNTMKISPATNIENTLRRSKVTIPGYHPNQIRHAYGIDKLSASGKGQTIAIIDSYGSPTIDKDLNVFNKKFKLDSSMLIIKYPDGKPTTTDSSWAIETTLDVEWVHALAPKANILLVVAKSDSSDDLMNAVDYASKEGANVISMSWGGSEFSDMSIYNDHFKCPNTVYIASTGDNGAGVQWPAVVPNVLAVGGTTLTLNSGGDLMDKETAWSGSGGGVSSYVNQPSYQKIYGIKANNFRTVPDVSFCADPNTGVAIYSTATSWVSVGGTSIGAPAWGAFITLVNENRSVPLSNVQNRIYGAASISKYNTNFRDIILGSNGSYIINSAHEGYDYVTGLGSPLENNLYDSLVK